ncbi:hypothetical protein KEM54_005638, partial [Ascosphaera aggregata]
MASGRPHDDHGTHNGDLLQLDDAPIYSSGQPPPVRDDQLLERFDIADTDAPSRPSVSYDSFVGGRAPGLGGVNPTEPPLGQPLRRPPSPAAAGGAAPSVSGAPSAGIYMGSEDASKIYTQTDDLDNFHRYSDLDNYQDDPFSDENYVQAGAPPLRDVRQRDRNTILSIGDGFVGRAKSMLGMNDYSEMDLPLTESGARAMEDQNDSAGPKESPIGTGRKRLSANAFKFGIKRKKVDASSLGPRIIYLNNSPANAANKFKGNSVSTAKYNFATFIPKFLFEQFSKYANLFFLFTAVLQQIPNISPTNRYTTIVPLVIVLTVSAIKELYEDYKRRVSDRGLNHSRARILRGSTFEETKWTNVKVGDILRVESEEPFPADLVLLASSEPEGLCYIETANLDGETNLKVKQAIPETASLVSPADLSRIAGRLKSEQPNSSLYTYEATLTMHAGGGEKELPLAPDQLLLRGATLRNTPWIHGVVVFT